jgi:hypothetical protein
LNGFPYIVRPLRAFAATIVVTAAVFTVTPVSAFALPMGGGGGQGSGSGSATPLGERGLTKQEKAGATFGAGPSNKKKPDGRTYFDYNVSPGGRLSDHIAVLNLTYHPEVLRVYTVDVVPGSNGSYLYQPRAAKRVSTGGWVAVGTPHASGLLRARPRSTTVLPVHLRVPRNASPGDHVGAIIVSLTSLVKGKSGQRVDLEQRVATRVLVRVLGPLHPRLAIENLHASYKGKLNPFASGSAAVTYTVHNTGNAILGATQQVSVHGLFGSTAHAKSLPIVQPLLPGGSIHVTVHVPGVFPEFLETAKVSVTPQGIVGEVNPGLHTVTASTHFWAIPWILLAIILLLIGLAVLAYVRRRRRKRGVVAPSTTIPVEGVPS